MIRALAGLALALAVSASALAQNNGLPDARQSVVFVKAVAVRGVEANAAISPTSSPGEMTATVTRSPPSSTSTAT